MFIATAIHYTNGKPHIGHALEFIVTDGIVRWYRMNGKPPYFLTGTDEHGQKIERTAALRGLTPKQLCDENSQSFKDLCETLKVTPNRFIRTTDSDHCRCVHDFFNKCKQNGDIYKGEYSGWYNVREECYVTQKDAALNDFKDPTTQQPLIEMKEPSYFFRLSRYVGDIIKVLEQHQVDVVPSYYSTEIINRLKSSDIEDLSISRPITSVSWGIPVPDDDTHTLYVWFEALINYVTGTRLPSYQPVDIHVIGKDIVWFHSVVWFGMLLSAKLELPKRIFVHGFVCDEQGQKMSKSVGNVVDPVELLDKYSSTPVRYYILNEFCPGADLKFSEYALVQAHDSNLLKNLGNYVSRVFSMTAKYAGSKVPKYTVRQDRFDIQENLDVLESYITHFELGKYCEHVFGLITGLNTYITETCIWQIQNEKYPDDKRTQEFRHNVLRTLLEGMAIISAMLFPIVPEVTLKIDGYLKFSPQRTIRGFSWKNLKAGNEIEVNPPKLFAIVNQQANQEKMKKNMKKRTEKNTQ
jgi:methionyl-tRNA synthetase